MYPIWIKQNLNEFRPRVSKTTSHICTARTRMLSSITNQNQNDNYAWMLLIYFPHDHGFRERMTISTIIRRMIIAMQVHFRVFFCSFFAFWRRFVPVSICSAAPVTWAEKIKSQNNLNLTMSMVQIIPCRTRVLQTIYQWQEPITIPVSQCCPASLLELRPRHPSRGKSAFRSILYLVKAASPWNLNVGGLAIHYLMQIMKLLLNLFHCIVSLLDLLQCVQHLQKCEI